MNQIKQEIYDLAKQLRKLFSSATDLSGFEEKSSLDYVTDMDLKLQSLIFNKIRMLDNQAEILSEETVKNSESLPEKFWMVDPLDGTSNFLGSIPFSSVSLALFDKRRVIFGAVIDLNSNDIFTAFAGNGAFLNGEKIESIAKPSSLIGISTGLLKSSYADFFLKKILVQGKTRILGSQALHLCYVACGRFSACINLEAKIWDDAAGSLIITEANGHYSSNKINDFGEWNLDDLHKELDSIAATPSANILFHSIHNFFSEVRK